ncbi:integrase, partial [Salmonella enterica]|nr:integrase [Salmonella enterica]
KITEKTATGKNKGEKPINFTCHDARRTFGSVAELAGVGSYILKRLMNHRAYRSADVTQGYLHFSADELREPARLIETKILKEAGVIIDTNKDKLDSDVLSLLADLSDDEKIALIKSIIQKGKGNDK